MLFSSLWFVFAFMNKIHSSSMFSVVRARPKRTKIYVVFIITILKEKHRAIERRKKHDKIKH